MRTIALPRLLFGQNKGVRAIPGASARAWCRSWWGAGLTLIILCLAVYLPGLWSIPPVDRDESRFAQASRTMLESRDFIVPRLGDTPRLNKPPLIYWLQSASAAILGDAPGKDGLGEWGNGNIWVFRLPSVLCAIGTVLLTWRLGLRMFDPRAAALAAALLAICPMVVWDAHQARADQLLLFTTTAAMFALFVCWKQTTSTTRTQGVALAARPPVVSTLLLWTFIGLGILAKGPITPMVAALTAITISIASRNWRWLLKLRPILGFIIVAALVGPWVYLIIQRVGWGTYWTTIKAETLGRSVEGRESHGFPPGFHTILLPVLFWPGSLMTAAAIVSAWKKARRPGAVAGSSEPATRPRRGFRSRPETFLLAWLLPAWLVFELIATKLPHYTMPLYPAIALLTARTICAAAAGTIPFARSFLDRIGVIIWGGIGIAGLIGSLGLFVEVGGFDFTAGGAGRPLLGLTTAFLLAAIGGAVWFVLSRRGLASAHVLAGLAIVLWCWMTLAWVLPRCSEFWISSRLAALIEEARWPEQARRAPVALVNYEEPSAMFLLRGRGGSVAPSALQAWIKAHPGGVLAINSDHGEDVGQPLDQVWIPMGFVPGFNYSSGKPVDVRVFRILEVPTRGQGESR
jgi:4-amino-4-deoxy-L-arabinose transferase-like glycosyltransferase